MKKTSVSAVTLDTKLIHIHYTEENPPEDDEPLEYDVVLRAKKNADIPSFMERVIHLDLCMQDGDGFLYAEERGLEVEDLIRTDNLVPHPLYEEYGEDCGWAEKIEHAIELASKEHPEYGIEALDFYSFSPRQLWEMDEYEDSVN